MRFADPVPPTRLQPKVRRDLEAVCLKCLEKSPDRRYQTAAEVAADLRCFLNNQPTRARPTSWMSKSLRWCRRNSAASALALSSGLLVALLAIGGPIVAFREKALRLEAAHRAAQAETEQRRADDNLVMASRALEATLEQVHDRVRRRPDSLRGLDRDVWQSAIPYLEEFVRQPITTTEQRARHARAAHLLARTLADQGQAERATQLFAEASTELQTLSAASGDTAALRRDMALCQMEFGEFLLKTKHDGPAAEAQLRAAIAGLEGTQDRIDLAAALHALGVRFTMEKVRWPEARPFFEREVDIRRSLAEERPDQPAFAIDESVARLRLAVLLDRLDERKLAAEQLARAVIIEQKLARRNVADPEDLLRRTALQEYYSTLLAKTGRWDEACALKREALDTADRLANAFPAAVMYTRVAAMSHETAGAMYSEHGDWPEAERQLSSAVQAWHHLLAATTVDAKTRAEIVDAHRMLAELHRRCNRPSAAAQEYRRALPLVVTAPTAGDPLCRPLALVHLGLGEMIFNTEPRDALEHLDQALAFMPADKDRLTVERAALAGKAKVYVMLGLLTEARDAQEQLRQLPAADSSPDR